MRFTLIRQRVAVECSASGRCRTCRPGTCVPWGDPAVRGAAAAPDTARPTACRRAAWPTRRSRRRPPPRPAPAPPTTCPAPPPTPCRAADGHRSVRSRFTPSHRHQPQSGAHLGLHGVQLDGRLPGGVSAQEAHAAHAPHAVAGAAQVQDAEVEATAALGCHNDMRSN